jgi:hypothetical protein
MMRFRLGFALSVSLILILGALFFRFVYSSRTVSYLATVPSGNSQSDEALNVTDDSVDITDTTTTPENLNTTDLVARQLFSDYLDLTSQGAVTDETVANLADKYAENVLSLNSFSGIKATDLKTVPDSKEAMALYGQNVTTIYDKYQSLTKSAAKKGGDLSQVDSPLFSTTMDTFGKLYLRAADELKNISVPSSLVDIHMQLVNNYLSSAEAIQSISKINSDSASAFAALNAQAQNSENETGILLNIQMALASKGVPFAGGI